MITYPENVIQPKAIGYWKSVSLPDLPDPHNFIDFSISTEQRQAIIQYLENGLAFFHYLGHSFCRFNCGKPEWEMGCSDLTDGTFAWPEGLSHYIKEHSVWLPSEFIEHAMSNMNFDKTKIDQRKLAQKNDAWWKCFTSLQTKQAASAFKIRADE
ncbi:hypothetical protein [Flavisolibacter tropicus]|uniref:Uncharacterized protein n=1 Tax=Flavisolibacter tropicus TaxID=1492898 RepID=A0A172TTN4_9BACT|nr:hypothetical protein [Flavisolibacter tropicus]ANE50117.1 hypothetical protein SY85_06005 [Flavisolibacter tropicus]